MNGTAGVSTGDSHHPITAVERTARVRPFFFNRSRLALLPGMIAYVEGQAVGWLGFWPRERFERLVRSRTIPKIDDQAVWSIVCFKIRVGYRRRGVAKALLAGAIEFARERRVPVLEAYPIDSGGKRLDVASAYVGFTKMFEDAGFRRVCQTTSRSAGRPRFVMRLEVGS